MLRVAGLFGGDAATRRNVKLLLVKDGLLIAGGSLCSTLLMQTFLVKMGLDNSRIGAIGSVISIAYIAGTLLFAGLSDRIGNSPVAIAICSVVLGVTPLTLAAAGMLGGSTAGAGVVFALVLAACVVQNLAAALKFMLEIKLYGKLLDVRILGVLFGIDGAIGAAASVGLGLIASVVLGGLGYPWGFVACFYASLFLYAASAWAVSRLKAGDGPQVPATNRSGPIAGIFNAFRAVEFKRLAAAHFVRGLESGAVYFILLIGMKNLKLAPVYAAYLTALSAVAGICGNLLFISGVRRTGAGWMCTMGSLAVGLGLVGIALAHTVLLFAALFFFIMAGQTWMDQGVPLGIYTIVESETIGAYTGARMILMMAGSAISTWSIGLMLDRLGPVPIFSAVAVLYAACGASFNREFRLLKKGEGIAPNENSAG